MSCYPNIPHLLSDLGEIRSKKFHVFPLSIYELRADRRIKGYAFLVSVNEITFTCVKNVLVKSVYNVTECITCGLVKVQTVYV